MKMVQDLEQIAREVVKSSSLEIFKTQMDRLRATWSSFEVSSVLSSRLNLHQALST